MKPYILILLICLGIQPARAQCVYSKPKNLPKQIQAICKGLGKNIVEGSHLGYSGSPSDIYPYFEKLKTVATDSQLILLTSYPAPAVRSYSFWALKDRHIKKETLLNIVFAHLCDTQIVETASGCIMERTTVGDYFFNELKADESYGLTDAENKKIDSLIFWVPGNGLYIRNEIVRQTEVSPINYPRLKTLLLNEGVAEALLPLLAAQKTEDLNLVTTTLTQNPEQAFEAISKYPLPQFQPFLINWQKTTKTTYDDNDSWLAFYNTAIAYNNYFSVQILKTPLHGRVNDEVEFHASRIYWDLRDNRNPIFDSIKIATLNYISDMEQSYFANLWQIDSVKCLSIIERRLTTENHPFWQDSMLDIMANKIVQCEKGNAVNIINKILSIGYSSTFLAFSKVAHNINNVQTIEVYKKRFFADEHEDEQSLDYGIDGILAFDNPLLYKAIKEKALAYAKLQKFQNSRSLKKLLEKINAV